MVTGAAFLHAFASSERPDRGPLGGGSSAARAHNHTLMLGQGELGEDDEACPTFGKAHERILQHWLTRQIASPPSAAFVKAFLNATRQPSKAVAKGMADLLAKNSLPWPPVGRQQEILVETIQPLLETARAERDAGTMKRRAIIVTGGPGSGKTALAVRTLLTAGGELGMNTRFVSTSGAHNHTLVAELERAATGRAQRAERLSEFQLAKPTDLRVAKDSTRPDAYKRWTPAQKTPSAWQAYCEGWRKNPKLDEALDRAPKYDVIVCDEAQGLIDGLKEFVDGTPSNPWRKAWGPQAFHLMASARLTVFLMDGDQGYRQVESTSPEDIARIARAEGIEVVPENLGCEQFRLTGGYDYLRWLDETLGLPPAPFGGRPETPEDRKRLAEMFAIVDDAGAMRDRLRGLHERGEPRSRLLAGYAWKWASKKHPTELDSAAPPGKGRMPVPNLAFRWVPGDSNSQRNFNIDEGAYANPEVLFGEGTSKPATVGYPLTVRGQDFDHIGVLWGADLVRRGKYWVSVPDSTIGTDLPGYRKAARDEAKRGWDPTKPPGPANARLAGALARAYRILLTRAMKSVRLWVEDDETREYLRRSWAEYLGG